MDYELMMNGNIKLGQIAPDFSADTTCGKISLDQYTGKWLVLFSHSGDFTPVCTTEMIAFSKANKYFKQLNTELLSISIDSVNSHIAWMKQIYINTNVKVSFPMIADRSGEISRKYGMIASDVSKTQTVRNIYIIDDKKVIRAIFIYPINIGRFIPEILRTIEALQMTEKTGTMTPVNWIPNQDTLEKEPDTYEEMEKKYIDQNNSNDNFSNGYLNVKSNTEIKNQFDEQNFEQQIHDSKINETVDFKKTPNPVKSTNSINNIYNKYYGKRD